MLRKLFNFKGGEYAIGVVLTVLFYFIFAAVFAALFYFFDIDRKYIPFVSSICLAAAVFLSSFFTAKNVGEKGYLIGLIIGGAFFALVTLISLFVSKGKFSLNTLFHFILTVLSSTIGGILGVGTGNKKII